MKDTKAANIEYHDWEAATYDEKWHISYDDRCIEYARARYRHVAGDHSWGVDTALELGSGTGFFLLNLMQAGVAKRGVVTDISAGMVGVATRNGRNLDLDITGTVADAEFLPIASDSVDLVVGHAVLHHIPDIETAMREVIRILRPGGRFVFCGEPTRYGDVIARRLSRLTWAATTVVTHAPGLRSRWAKPKDELKASSEAAALEAVVDVHTFDPRALAATCMRAGAIDVVTATDELTAAWFGWPVRTFEAAVNPQALGWSWAQFAYKSWLALSAFDERLMSKVVPAQLFYNVSITGIKP